MSVIERALQRLRQPAAHDSARHKPTLGSTQRPPGLSAQASEGSQEPKIFVDRSALRAAGYLPDSNQDRILADEYRQIKRQLIAAAFDPEGGPAIGDPRVIFMASALPGDGKTFTSINLALSLSREKDCSALLVDADAARPHVSQIFGVEQERGLLDALADDSLDIEDLVMPTDVPGLSILPAGKAREPAAELLASERMSSLMQGLLARRPRRLIVLDSSPILVTSDSRGVAAIAGQVVLVVRAGKTPQNAVAEALNEIGEGRHVGLVLNQGRRRLFGDHYGYGTYREYGQESGKV